MEKQGFFEKIQNVLRDYYQTTPCRNCTIAEEMEGCINCHKKHIDTQLWDNVKQLKDEYKKQFGTDYDSDYRDIMIKNYRETSKKENIINFLNKCTVEDILEVAVELGKTDKLVSFNKADKVFQEMLVELCPELLGYGAMAVEWENEFRKRLEE